MFGLTADAWNRAAARLKCRRGYVLRTNGTHLLWATSCDVSMALPAAARAISLAAHRKTLAELGSCNICNICMHGFKLDGNVGATARRTGFGLRYRNGIYFSSGSGKANDYAAGTKRTATDGRELRCTIVSDVAAGRAYVTNQTRLGPDKCPPPGYDSVGGEVGPALNYDKLVVYREEAALPAYLVVYSLT